MSCHNATKVNTKSIFARLRREVRSLFRGRRARDVRSCPLGRRAAPLGGGKSSDVRDLRAVTLPESPPLVVVLRDGEAPLPPRGM